MTLTKTSVRTRIRKAQTPSLVLFQQDLLHIATFVALLRQIDRRRKQTKKIEPNELHKAWLEKRALSFFKALLSLSNYHFTPVRHCYDRHRCYFIGHQAIYVN
ncbi:MAG: hypothetical protein ACOYT8_06180 [Candidatus Dependentiae bacterium]